MELAGNERDLQLFLKQNKVLVQNAYNAWAWNYVETLPEFDLGGEGRVDFLVLSADSGSWHATIVELKSHRDKSFTKRRTPTAALAEGLKQLDHRENWVRQNQHTFRRFLSRFFEQERVPAYCSHVDKHLMAFTEILDDRTYIDLRYQIVVGRRDSLTPELQLRRNDYKRKGHEISTYDRMVDVAKRLDQTDEAT